MKLLLPRITGTWCMEFDCWPENHPGCDRRLKHGCQGCEFAQKTIIVEGGQEELDIGERAQ